MYAINVYNFHQHVHTQFYMHMCTHTHACTHTHTRTHTHTHQYSVVPYLALLLNKPEERDATMTAQLVPLFEVSRLSVCIQLHH